MTNGALTAEFLHHLRTTIIMLGGGTKLANMVERAESASATDVDELRQLNINLIDSAKDRLANINTITVATSRADSN